MPAETTGGLAPGEIQLYDSYIPSLAPGAYEIVVTPSVTGIPTGGWFQEIRQSFEVRAPQFSVDPGDVGETYPPSGANGMYGADLPFVVLNRRALPWERPLVAQDRGVPWLALLTLAAGEIVLDEATRQPLRTSTVAQFLLPDPGGQVDKPAVDPEKVPPEVLAATMQSIVVPAAVFTGVVPRLDELGYLAHVRATDTGAQAQSDALEDGFYAVVFSNRFPASEVDAGLDGPKSYACLVSLEGYAGILPGSGAPSRPYVALAVLHSFAFVSNPGGKESFSGLMERLVQEEAGVPGNLLPRIPASGPPSAALTRLGDGYAPLTYHTITGEKTFAWYRGPFSPVVPPPLPPPANGSLYLTASELTIYQQAEGVFDLSYAAAFAIGRAIALADRAFSIAMLAARRQVAHKLHTIAERMATGRFDDLPVRELLAPGLERKRLTAKLNAGAAEELRRTFLSLGAATATKEGAPLRARRERAARADPAARTRALLRREDVRGVIAEHVDQEMGSVTEFLAKLALLENVPFNHLVPDQRLLPADTIRFFYVDPFWIEALVDGALSMGVEGSRSVEITAVMRAPIQRSLRRQVGLVRAGRRRLPRLDVTTSTGDFPVKSGLLLRSAAVSGWPGLVVQADGGATNVLRMERLSESILLVLFDAVPGTVELSEPLHGLRFGVRGVALQDDVIQLRTALGVPLGTTWPASPGLRQYYRAQTGPGARVLDLQRMVPDLGAAVGFTLGPATFATEMIRSPERLSFVPGGGSTHVG